MIAMQCIGKLTRSDSFSMEISKDIARDGKGNGDGDGIPLRPFNPVLSQTRKHVQFFSALLVSVVDGLANP